MADDPTIPPARPPGPALHVKSYEDPVVRRRPNRAVAWFRGWADENLSRENVGAGVRTLLWVAPLTALIWVWAERQQLQPGDAVLPIAVVSNDPTKAVRIIRPADGNVVVKLRGPKAALDEAIKKFNPLTGNRPAEILLDRTTSTGEQTIRALRIKDDKRLADAGIDVVSVEPEEIRIYVDQIVSKKFRVEVADPRRFGTPPVFDPPEVTVSGPERVLGNPATLLRLEADVAARLNGLPPSDREVVLKDVKLALAGADGKNITLAPPAVTARVIPVATKDTVLTSVRLFAAGTIEIINANEFAFDPPNLLGVTVSGPADAIEKLDPQNAPFAYVQVQGVASTAGTAGGEGEAPFELQLPPGVVSKDPRKTVRVTVKPR